MNKEVEILKIGSIIPTKGKDTIMVVFDGGPLFDHYVKVLKEKCNNEYRYLKGYQSTVGTPEQFRSSLLGRVKVDRIKGIQLSEPKIGYPYFIEGSKSESNWHTSEVKRIIDDNILITINSVYVIHDVSKLRDKILNDLGI